MAAQATSVQSASPLSVEIVSPNLIDGVPGLEQKIQARIMNSSDHSIQDVMGYITMANLTRHMTVNLEDYNADKPVTIGKLEPRESKVIDLPIRLVYTGRYHLYVTVVSSEMPNIASSIAIPVTITSNSKLDIRAVTIVSVVVPSVLLLVSAGAFMITKWRPKSKAYPAKEI
ncbi:hypothetical protein [Gorillibacterium massiliense]|uniref:hypothetical protein n=1 Tax=Gorillibacterium massiliense TaxID=1280390 RepID=UPI0012DC6585|nr:hypothetical protein [Gorillibacterium massiliense]